MSTDVLIVAGAQSAPGPAARELATLARRLAQVTGKVAAFVVAEAQAPLADWGRYGIDVVYRAASAAPDALLPDTWLAAATEAYRLASPRVVLMAHAPEAAELAPRLAFRLEGAVATGCIDIAWEPEAVRCVRACFGGIAREEVLFAHVPIVATVAAGLFERHADDPGRAPPQVVELALPQPSGRVRRVERRTETAQGRRLEDARVIVAGGRGLDGPEGFELLGELAAELDAAIGASRVPCDLGWCPHSWQIGLTGATVTPELYVAVGISGAGQHMAGCGRARGIVAINSDPQAAIFEDARFGVVGDYREVVPALTAALRRLKATANSG